MSKLSDLKLAGEAPDWLTEEAYETLSKGYLLQEETPRQMYRRVADSVAKYLKAPQLSDKFYSYIDKNWLCPASPVASNSGTERGLPISCFAMSPDDSMDSIAMSWHETAMLTKMGGGVAKYWGRLRQRGKSITSNGISDGVIPWLKVEESVLQSVSQGGVRRGSGAQYLDVESNEIDEFLDIRRPNGDLSRRCLSTNFHHAVCISDDFMEDVRNKKPKALETWIKLLSARLETGEPYIFFKDTVNRGRPDCYKDKGLEITNSNLCLQGDTEVLTAEYGPVKIKNLVGKTVTIFDGNSWVSNNRFRKTSNSEELIKITLRDKSEIVCTPYHNFFINGKKIKAINLKVKDRLDFAVPENKGLVSSNGAYIKGFLVGDGTHINDRPVLCLYSTKYMCSDRLVKSTMEIPVENLNTNAISNVKFSGNSSNRQFLSGLSVRKQELIKWSTEYKKDFPKEVYTWDEDSQAEFLAGLFDSDGGTVNTKTENGTIGSRCYQIVSVHKSFLTGLRDFLKTKNIYSSLNTLFKSRDVDFNDGYGSYSCKESFRLTISNVYSRTMSKLVSFSRLINFDTEGGYKSSPYFSEILSIEKLESKEEVYCTTVSTTNKFLLANGVMSGNCSEITLFCDPEHSFVCCLSSLNVEKYDEWKDSDLVETAIWFLDGVMEEFIQKASSMPGFENAVRFAKKSRALGLGILGWHSFLQKKMVPFESFQSMQLNNEIWRLINSRSLKASKELAEVYGEVEWTKGHGIRNTHRLCVAPTMSNALISGNLSQGIEPIVANIFAQKTAKGVFVRRNRFLENLLIEKGKNTTETWEIINGNDGSVRSLPFLSVEEKEVFATAREISQLSIINQASQRQQYIDQAQSVNIFIRVPSNPTPEDRKRLALYMHKLHLDAHEKGLKTLYYTRAQNIIKGDTLYRDECKTCEG